MKLLCDVCENAVACTVCCADEAALCSACDSQVHAANKLASKHQRVPLIPDTSEPATCDICQERPSFFFCVEDRALLCRDCDLSVHSANALAAKHRRILLVGITVGISPPQETSSALTVEKHMPATTYTSSPKENNDFALKNSGVQDFVSAVESRSKDNGGMGKKGPANKLPPSPQRVSNKTLSLALAPINAKSVRVYTRTKEGSLRMASNNDTNNDHRKAAPPANTQLNSTTISIQRISEGHRAPFVAPVLSSIRSTLLREEANSKNPNNSSSRHRNNDYYSNSDSVMMDLDASSPVEDGSISDYLNSDASGWRLDELLSDLVGACDSAGRTLSPPKESNIPGFGLHEEHPWFAELDFLEEHELSPSQEESVALVPQMPSPPTHSGLGVSRGPGKPKFPAADQPWAFDYLFSGPDDNTNEFSVVPDVCGRRSLPASSTSPPRGNVKKKRKYWLNAANG